MHQAPSHDRFFRATMGSVCRHHGVTLPMWGLGCHTVWDFGFRSTYSLHCSSFWGLPFRILNIDLVKPKKGTTMETIGRVWCLGSFRVWGLTPAGASKMLLLARSAVLLRSQARFHHRSTLPLHGLRLATLPI